MTHGRKPRRPRPVRAMAFYTARNNAARLTDAEREEAIGPARECFARLREGVATEDQHTVLYTILRVGQGIEETGVVRGLSEHLASALQAMDTIRARAIVSGAWRATALYHYELDAIRTAVDLHEFQLQQLSAGELHAVTKRLIARTLSSGGEVERRPLVEMGLT